MTNKDYRSKLEFLSKNIANLRKHFTDAKNKYDELSETYKINEYFSLEGDQSNLKKSKHSIYEFCATKLKESENYKEKLSNILAITKNEFIDVIFIGRCSVGKSKIINAILMENILPCAPSATTHCFVEINKSNDDANYLRCNKNEKKSFKFDDLICEVNNNVSKMSDSCFEFNETVQIYLTPSKWKTKLTNSNQNKKIRLIDTPGYDNCKLSTNFNDDSLLLQSIIDRCKIANIIVFVVTHNLSDKEKEILMELYKISSKLSIIFLVNKWDLSDDDPAEISDVSKSQIRDSFVENKIYFVSAFEQLKQISAQNNNNNNKLNEPSQQDNNEENDNFNERKETFSKFIEDLNTEINDEFGKFDTHICSSKEFNFLTTDKYEEYVQNLSSNIEHFINILNEIKKKLDKIKNKIKENISQMKQKENTNSDFVDKLGEYLDSVAENLQEILTSLFDDFINENYSDFNKYHEQIKQSNTKSYHKISNNRKQVILELGKSIKNSKYKIKFWRNENDEVKENETVIEVGKDLTESTIQPDNVSQTFMEFIDSYLSETTEQIDNMSKFFNEYRNTLKTL